MTITVTVPRRGSTLGIRRGDIVRFGFGGEAVLTNVTSTTITVRRLRWYDRVRWWFVRCWRTIVSLFPKFSHASLN